jgi:hypothetical protein
MLGGGARRGEASYLGDVIQLLQRAELVQAAHGEGEGECGV